MADKNDGFVYSIAEALADAKGVEPGELDCNLQEHIEVKALERLITTESKVWTCTFQISNQEVVVKSDGVIIVDDEVYSWTEF